MNRVLLPIFLFLLTISNAFALDSFQYGHMAQIPILANGRIKPLDTFARIQLQRFHNKDKLDKISAIEWLTEVIFLPNETLNKRFFRIINPEVLDALGIVKDPSNNYGPAEIITAFQNHTPLIEGVLKTSAEEQTPAQKQISELYANVQVYIEISRSFSMIFQDFEIKDAELAKKLRLDYGKKISYLEIMNQEASLRLVLGEMVKNNRLKNPTLSDKNVMEVLNFIDFTRQDDQSNQLKIFPPTSQDALDDLAHTAWYSPWKLQEQKQFSLNKPETFLLWNKLYTTYIKKDFNGFNSTSEQLLDHSLQNTGKLINPQKLKFEKYFNQLNLFSNSAAFYILSFLFFAASSIGYKRLLEKLSFGSLIFGLILHGSGIAMRCFIMGRPPVSSLYESIIFVSFIAVLLSLFLEIKNKNSMGLFIGSSLGAILLFVSFGYEKDGDSMGMLVAVLDTNFWLATHVVTISIGYGCSLVASLLAHLFLFRKIFSKCLDQSQLAAEKRLIKNIHGTVLFSLFFTVLGTILGGIWADQSWGRFWGWDPKENGALLLALWLLFIVHGKLAGYFKNTYFALATCLTSVIVILAWFGVNLLNVGLHSYGFTESIAQNIIIFVTSEFLIMAFLFFTIKVKAR